jgi:hypothetical protein
LPDFAQQNNPFYALYPPPPPSTLEFQNRRRLQHRFCTGFWAIQTNEIRQSCPL